MTDWRDLPKGELTIEQLPPANLDDSYGPLEGAVLSGCSITEGYYTDSRASAKLELAHHNLVDRAAIRISYRVPELGYSEELGTFFPASDGAKESDGSVTATLDLVSALHAMSLKENRSPHWLAQGSYALTAMRQVCEDAHRELLTAGANDYMYTEAKVLESGGSSLERLFALCDDSGNRLDVDGHGRIVASAYVAPSARVPSFEIDLLDPKGTAHDGIEMSSDRLSLPSEVHVIYRWTEGSGDSAQQMEVSGTASNPAESFGVRGYIVSDAEVVNELDPPEEWMAQQEAEKRLALRTEPTDEWSLTTEYLPIHQGHVGWLRGLPDGMGGPDRLVMVKSADISLDTMRMRLTLKGAESVDTE